MKLKLTIKQIRGLQTKHGIANLLQPGEDAAKLASIDVLADIYYEGSRSWEKAPSKAKIEEIDLGEIMVAVKAFLSGDTEGKA